MSYRETRTSHSDVAYFPTDGERIEEYAEKIKQIISQQRHNFIEHQKWWEHRGTKPCRICNTLDMLEYIAETLQEIDITDKKAKWQFMLERTTQDSIIHLRRTQLKH